MRVATLHMISGTLAGYKKPVTQDMEVEAEHDIILFDPEITEEMVSDYHKSQLEQLGAFFSHYYGCWAVYT